MYINVSFVTYHVTECFQRRSSSCRICHACSAMQMLQICLFLVGYDILRQCIITPVKRAHDTLIQNIVSTSYYPTASNSKTFIESSRRNTWLHLNVCSCRSAKKITLADNHAWLVMKRCQRWFIGHSYRYLQTETTCPQLNPWNKELEKEREVETRESDPENDDEDLE